MPPDPRTWLFDVIQAGSRAQRFLSGRTWSDYQADELLRAGTERQFEIVGEALNHLRLHAPDLPGGYANAARSSDSATC